MSHPSTTLDAPVARCYVCDGEVSKARMVCIGPDKMNEGKYIFRCEDCHAGSRKWIKYFMNRSALRVLYENSDDVKRIQDEARAEAEAGIKSEPRRRGRRKAVSKESGVAAPKKVARREGGLKTNGRAKKERWRNVVIRKVR